MQCRQCGTEIADKALICYRCGTATTEAKFKPVAVPSGRSTSPLILILLVVAAILLVWNGISLQTGVDAWQNVRWVAIAVLVVAIGVIKALRRR